MSTDVFHDLPALIGLGRLEHLSLSLLNNISSVLRLNVTIVFLDYFVKQVAKSCIK